MADIIDELKSDVKQDRMIRAAKRFGPWVILAVLLLVATVGALSIRNHMIFNKQAESGLNYYNASQANDDEAARLYNIIANEGEDGYKSLAGLQHAAILLKQQKPKEALTQYIAIYDDTNLDIAHRELSGLLAAQTAIQLNDKDNIAKIDAILLEITKHDKPWRNLAIEFQAMHQLSQGLNEEANTTLQILESSQDLDEKTSKRLERLRSAYGI